MTDMTPAPISVEMLRDLLDKASEWRCTGDVLRCTDGNGCECDLSGNPSPWMDLQSAAVNALPALLQKLAEYEMAATAEADEVDRRGETITKMGREIADLKMRLMAAERARDEADRDTARLDWLTADGAVDRNIYQTIGLEWCAQDDVIGAWYGSTPREAIDNAIAAYLAASGGANESR